MWFAFNVFFRCLLESSFFLSLSLSLIKGKFY